MKRLPTSLRSILGVTVLVALILGVAWWAGRAGQETSTLQALSPLAEPVSPLVAPADWPTPTSWPTPTPWVEPTIPPIPTLLPTPEVTPIPLASPPFIPELAGKSTEPYRIAFRIENKLWIMNNDGSDLKMILDSESRMSLYLGHSPYLEGVIKWASPSPDGKTLALVFSDVFEFEHKAQEAHFSIYRFDVDTEELDFLVEGVDPEWSPDGSQVAFRDAARGLSVVDVATKAVRKVYSVGTSEYIVWDFTWSPDEARIAFVHKIGALGGVPKLLVADLAGQDEASPLVPETIPGAANPSWSPVGEDIVFITSVGKHTGPLSSRNLWKATASGSSQTQMTEDLFIAGGNPHWSSDGEWILLVGIQRYASPKSIYCAWLMKSDGNLLQRLTEGEVSNAFWSPDDTQVILQKAGEGIWTIDLKTGIESQLYPGETTVSYYDLAILRGPQ